MKKKEVTDLFKSFKNRQILIVGDVMIDAYCYGNVDRISPEAPVPVVACYGRENRLGGAANVALNVQSLGAVPLLCSVIGEDEKGSVFFDLLKDLKLPNDGILLDKSRPTTSKTRIMSQHQQLLRIDEEVDHPISTDIEIEIIERVSQLLTEREIEAIIFEDYDKGVITPFVIEKVVEKALELDIPVLADPKKRNFSHYKNLTLFKPNYKELTEGLNKDVEKTNFEEIFEICKAFIQQTNCKYVMTTLSEEGVIICDETEFFRLPAEVRDIADVSGAGDTVISVTALCLSAGLSPKETAAIANLAGGLVCEKSGVVPISATELQLETEKFFAQ